MVVGGGGGGSWDLETEHAKMMAERGGGIEWGALPLIRMKYEIVNKVSDSTNNCLI